MSIQRIFSIIETSSFLGEALEVGRKLNLPNWWIVGGSLRDIIWSNMSQPAVPRIKDIDLIFFDLTNTSKDRDKVIENSLPPINGVSWSVKNQARMHAHNSDLPYEDIQEAMFCFPETVSSMAIRKTGNSDFVFFSCFGIEDLDNMVFRPTPHFRRKNSFNAFCQRIKLKEWLVKWPEARIEDW